MQPYSAVAVKSFQRSLAYRAANVAGILTNLFFGAVYIYIYSGLFAARPQPVGGLDLDQTITYAVLSQSLLMVMSAFGNLDLSEAIIKGDITADLIRPLDFYLLWASIDVGRAVYYVLLRGLPTFALCWLLFHPLAPASALAAALFPLSVALGIAISFALRFITASLAFWLTDVRGIHYLTNTLILFFSGFIVPVNFFPAPLRALTEALPFRALAHLPISIYLGELAPAEMVAALAFDLAWLVVLIVAGRLVLAAMMRRLAINGG